MKTTKPALAGLAHASRPIEDMPIAMAAR